MPKAYPEGDCRGEDNIPEKSVLAKFVDCVGTQERRKDRNCLPVFVRDFKDERHIERCGLEKIDLLLATSSDMDDTDGSKERLRFRQDGAGGGVGPSMTTFTHLD